MTAKSSFPCPYCDRKLSAETVHCGFCGQRVAATWSRDIRLVTDRFILKDVVMVFVIAVVVAELLVAGTSFLLGRGVLWMPPHIMGLILVFVLALSIFAAGVVLGNRITMAFLVTPVGVAWGTGSRQKKVDRTAAAVSMLAGSPTAAGASLLAVAQESGLLPWEEIRKVTAFPGPGVITLSNSWRPVLRLYVPAGEYEEVAALVDRYAVRAKEPRPRLGIRWGREAWVRIGFVLATVAATVLATVWYDFNLDDLWRPLFLAGLLVVVGTLIGGAARRVLGFVGTAITLYLFVRHMMEGFDPIIGPSGFDYGRSYSADPILFVLSVVGYLALLALGVRCVVGRISRE
ncbi:MAG: hypothetical protein GX604_00190 [Actinobacteria bacterium]|nr:hypothetical protein [Actinomycetota bacterium]